MLNSCCARANGTSSCADCSSNIPENIYHWQVAYRGAVFRKLARIRYQAWMVLHRGFSAQKIQASANFVMSSAVGGLVSYRRDSAAYVIQGHILLQGSEGAAEFVELMQPSKGARAHFFVHTACCTKIAAGKCHYAAGLAVGYALSRIRRLKYPIAFFTIYGYVWI